MKTKSEFADTFWRNTDRFIGAEKEVESLAELAKLSGINIQTMYNQRNRSQLPNEYDIWRICETLRTTRSVLFEEREEVKTLTPEEILASLENTPKFLDVCSILLQRKDKFKAVCTLLEIDEKKNL